jgi:hypothetical protein
MPCFEFVMQHHFFAVATYMTISFWLGWQYRSMGCLVNLHQEDKKKIINKCVFMGSEKLSDNFFTIEQHALKNVNSC